MTHVRERLPKFSMGVSVEIKGNPSIHYNYAGEPPKELMDQYKQLIGDGQARVSVTCDMAIKDFGTGATASVTVSLACDQSQNGIAQAAYLAGEAARFYAKDQRARGEAELRQIIQSTPPLPNRS